MKKFNTFFRGITLLLCLFSLTMYGQTYNGSGGTIPDDGSANCATTSAFGIYVPVVDADNSLVSVSVNISHTWNDDLDITLVAPDGTPINLSSDNGSSSDGYNVVFDDNASSSIIGQSGSPITGTFQPEQALSNLASQTIGEWTLVVCDDFDDSNTNLQSLNSWSLVFDEVVEPEPVEGESCENPLTINCGTSDSGTTSGFSSNSLGTCDTALGTAPGVFYKLEGYDNGDLVTASLCGSSFDTKIGVFSGDCNNLVCVAGNDDSCGTRSLVTFGVSANTDYYIYVTGFSSNSGSYTLDITCQAPLPGETCDTAEFIECGDSVSDTTAGYSSSSLSFCGTSLTSAPGRFYLLEGDGSFVTASLCGSSFDTKIGVFEGSCGSLVCVAGNDDECSSQSEVTFATTNGTVYYIYVTGFGTNSGAFTLDLTCLPPPENDVCSGAIGLVCGEVTTGDTSFATSEALADCDELEIDTAPGLWHSIVGSGGDIELDLSGSDFDTKLAVFSGACENLVCVASDDDGGDGLDSKLTFASTAGETYYIYVTGFSSNSGIYTLSVDCICDVYIEEGECIKAFSGYGPTSSVELTAVGLYGSGVYDYVWSDGQTGATVTVTPTEQTTYIVTLTDSAGCTSTASTTVLFENVVCNDNPNNVKVNVCHNGSQICISPNAVQAHLNHGDTLGACDVVVDCDTVPICDSRLKVPGPDAIDVATDIEISWGAATGLVDGYIISVGTTPGGADIIDNEDVGNTLSYNLTGLDFVTTYYVTIIPYNSNGQATGCESSVFTTAAGPWCSATSIACDGTATGNTDTDGVISGYLETCFDTAFGAVINDAPGVFFSFEGTGDFVTASTCDENFDTIIGIYTGDCIGLTCLTGNDDAIGCSNFTSEVEFASEVGTTYYIYVAEWSTGTVGGEFTLSLTCTAPPPPLDACANAEFIECGDTVSGSTTGLAINDLDDCGTSISSAPGKFYILEGNGDDITASTCNSASFDTKIAVFTGDCGNGGLNLICVGGNDDGAGCSGFTSEVSFSTELGSVYYIYVTGYDSGEFGDFDLTVTCETPPTPPGGEVECGTVLSQEYCYASDEYTGILYTSSNGSPLDIAFISGIIEGLNYDSLTIYDGTDENGTLIYENDSSVYASNLAGATATATTGNMYLLIESDDTVSCQNGSTPTTWFWEVSCALSREAPTTVSTPTWNLYPNPSTTGEVQLDLSNYLNQDVSIQMTDFSGKVLVNNNESNLQTPRYRVSTDGMSYGIYFVRVVTASGVSTKKLIIANR